MKCILEQQSSIVIFASPLVSLMMDKKAKFVPMGIVTGFFDENQSDASAIDKVLNRSVQLLYNKS